MAIEYAKAGVNVEAGYEAVALMRKHVQSTYDSSVVTDIGGFGGLYSLREALGSGMKEPILVSGTDGVGTKLKLAFMLDKHDTVGIDAVAMCVNDIICSGASPLFFLDYIACGKNVPAKIESIVSGVAEGCRQSHAVLIGGETAEMPGFYPEEEYDLAGFAVGIVDKSKVIDGSKVRPGDALIGLSSSGPHSNGFSLYRKVFGLETEEGRKKLSSDFGMLDRTLGETLLEPTRIYVKPMEALFKEVEVKAVSHVTGGGFQENIPRMLPDHTNAKIEAGSFRIPPLFELVKREGNISDEGMFNTFNMGIGMVLSVSAEDIQKTIDLLSKEGVEAFHIGSVVSSVTETPGVIL